MTLKELFQLCSNSLEFSDSPEFEATCIFEDLLSISKSKIFFDDIKVTDGQINIVESVINRRKNGEPLQYILGKWDFYDMTFNVGEGVLIPRPETETLVDFALEKIKDIENPVIYDLCAGSGCIGLTIANHRKDAKVFLLEKEEGALKYLKSNKEKYNLDNTFLIHGDLFEIDFSNLPNPDVILSNPPYIPASEIEGLQKEVHFEPITALDGGIDGLDFYRCIAEKWASKVRKKGYIALECGEEQSEDIINLFNGKYSEKQVIYDFNNIDRIVTFRI
jgi:release factor glutamine methyltransferase